HVQGNIRAEDGCLNLHGEVVGDISVPNAIINGVVRGNITCLQHLELAPGARVQGVVSYQNMEMALGAQVSGEMKPVAKADEGEMPEAPAA
ncbi:MAG: polymer-forming cytoskeletal protein, partial [Perlucidibaca sp.]